MRDLPAAPTSPLADIGFLMRVFFLVATAIRSNAGLPGTPPADGAGTRGVPALLWVAAYGPRDTSIGHLPMLATAADSHVFLDAHAL